jgi:hypothetical protein
LLLLLLILLNGPSEVNSPDQRGSLFIIIHVSATKQKLGFSILVKKQKQGEEEEAYGGNRSIPFSSMESKRLIGSLSRESCISMPSSIFWESLFARKLPQNLTTV